MTDVPETDASVLVPVSGACVIGIRKDKARPLLGVCALFLSVL